MEIDDQGPGKKRATKGMEEDNNPSSGIRKDNNTHKVEVDKDSHTDRWRAPPTGLLMINDEPSFEL